MSLEDVFRPPMFPNPTTTCLPLAVFSATDDAGSKTEIDIQSEKALYIVAFLAGFSERFFVRIIDKLMTTLLGGDSSASASKSGTAKASGSGTAK